MIYYIPTYIERDNGCITKEPGEIVDREYAIIEGWRII